MNETWYIELLGGLRATGSAQMITRFPTRKTGALLGYLAYYSHRPHAREMLIELLWPEIAVDAGRHRLAQALYCLRCQLEPPGFPRGAVFRADKMTVQLNPEACVTDVGLFDGHVEAASRTADTQERERCLAEAVKLYQGELLPGYFEEWISLERQRLMEAYLVALHQLAGRAEENGYLARAVGWLRQAVAADPLREESQAGLIRLLVIAGQREAAQRHYRQFEELLVRELGAQPATAVRDLLNQRSNPPGFPVHLQRLDREAGREASATAPSPPAPVTRPPGRLPPPLTRFFGREAEIEHLAELVRAQTKLVTLVGPGGVGKTRLAVQVGRQLRERMPGGIWFVPLLDLSDPRLIPAKIRDVLGLPPSPPVEPLEQVTAFFSGRPSAGSEGAVLLLDNFEHLVESGREIVHTLRQEAGSLVILITSRRSLGLEGEREFPVGPLPVPESSAENLASPGTLIGYPSVRLFVDRAQAIRPAFQLRERNAAAVASLCRRLEGLPLAIELAAARVGTLTPQQMLARLAQRFELLQARQQPADTRHQTLQSTLDWSYRLLPAALQRFFTRLAVFHGGWTLQAAAAVIDSDDEAGSASSGAADGHESDPLTSLESLRECSLVAAEESQEEMRYSLLETVREYADAKLTNAERNPLARRHARFYLQLAEELGLALESPEQPSALRLEEEQGNLRAALAWAAGAGEWEVGLQLCCALWQFWAMRGYWAEGRRWLAEFLALPSAAQRSPLRARALFAAGALGWFQTDYAAAQPLLEEALLLCRELELGTEQYSILEALGLLAHAQGHYAAASIHWHESLALQREAGDRGRTAITLGYLGGAAIDQGDCAAAQSYLEEALALNLETMNRGGAVLLGLGKLAALRGDYRTARDRYEEFLGYSRQMGSKRFIANTLLCLAELAFLEGNYPEARALHARDLRLHYELGDRRRLAACLRGLAAVWIAERQSHRAATILGAEQALRRSIRVLLAPVEQSSQSDREATLCAELGQEAFTAAWRQGEAMRLEQALEYALERTPAEAGQ